MKFSFSWFHKWGSPKYFYTKTENLGKIFGFLSIGLLFPGLFQGLFLVSPDYQQQDAFRIIYIHVPAAFLSLLIYSFIAIYSFIYLVWNIKVVDVLAKVSAPIGAGFTVLALLTGSIWGKPMWGTWWVWDARLTSELLLLFIYFGYIGLRSAFDNSKNNTAAKASALLGIVGFINVPIIHYSVQWWHTLHQGPSLSKFSKPSIATEMLWPLIICIIGFFLFYVFLIIMNARSEILWRERKNSWVYKELAN